MSATLLDHLFFAALVVALPGLAIRDHRQLRAAVRRGVESARLRAYRKVYLEEWGLVVALSVFWWSEGRSFADLGVGLGAVAPWRVLLGSGVVLAAVAFLIVQQREVGRDDEAREALREQMSSLRDMLPHSARELQTFRGLSVTAGICEEVLYRGFLLTYLGLTFPAWASVPLAAAIFGLAHAYQGGTGILKTGALGLVMALLYVLTGSLLQPVILHIAIDWINGEMAYEVIAEERA